MTLEIYKGVDIKQDKTIKQFKCYCVIYFKNSNPEYSKVVYGGSIEIIKRKIDKLIDKYILIDNPYKKIPQILN